MVREIERHFKVVLNRPELVNRIGDNVVVFDFIRSDVSGGEPFDQADALRRRIKRGVKIM